MQVDYKFRLEQIQAQDAADAPGAVRYLLRSAPEMIAAAAGMNWQDFLSTVELQTLARPRPGSGRACWAWADAGPMLRTSALLE